MTEAQRVHLRLLSILPKRTHEWTPPVPEGVKGRRRSDTEDGALRAELKHCEAMGMSRNDMRKRLHLGDKIISRLLGPGKKGWPKGRPRK